MVNINKKLVKLGIILILLIISNIYISGCINTPPSEKDKKTPNEDDDSNGDTNSVISANNEFALEYYSKLTETEDNIFFSPFSISLALAMTYEGARGQTAKEIQSVFHFPIDNNTRRTEFMIIYNETNEKDKEYQLNTANALWAQENYKFLNDYFSVIEKYYSGKVTNLDFVTDPEGSRKTINSWVENQTNNKIKDLIPKGIFDELTRLVLTNAIYFKGDWVRQFNESDTKEEDFKVSSTYEVKVPMMRRTDEKAKFNYTENEDLQIIELPYSGDDISMLVFLPKGDNLDNLEKDLSIKNLNNWKSFLKEQRVKLYLPKFKLETKYEMVETLKDMGINAAFGGADFSGMTGTKALFISNITHQAYIDVNEEGTEAAAATAVVVRLGGDPTPEFRADHPFIFLIQDKNSGNILFMGRVIDPSV